MSSVYVPPQQMAPQTIKVKQPTDWGKILKYTIYFIIFVIICTVVYFVYKYWKEIAVGGLLAAGCVAAIAAGSDLIMDIISGAFGVISAAMGAAWAKIKGGADKKEENDKKSDDDPTKETDSEIREQTEASANDAMEQIQSQVSEDTKTITTDTGKEVEVSGDNSMDQFNETAENTSPDIGD